MRSLVTGATGFIGSHLVEFLLQKGMEVRCLLRHPDQLGWLKGLPIQIIKGDCLEKSSLIAAVQGMDYVFHLAGVTRAVHAETYFSVNAQGTDHLVRACLQHNPDLKRFILLSSQAAAGPGLTNEKKKETDPCNPVSPYGESKRMAEEFCLKYCREIPLTILRPSAVYGPRDRDIYAQFKLIAKRIKPVLKNQVQQISFCYVQDVIQALWLAAQTPLQSGEIFFLSDGHDYRIADIGDAFEKALNLKALRLPVPKTLVSAMAFFSGFISKFSGKPALIHPGRAKEMAQKNWLCDMTKAQTMLGFNPEFNLMQGAALTAAWYKKQNWL